MVRGWLLGVGLLALAVAGVLWALGGEDAAGPMELSERTDLIAMVCAVVGGVAVLATLWRRPEEAEAEAVARLAREVKAIGEPQWTSSLGGDLKAIDVTFAFRPYAGARAAALPASPAGRLEQVVEDYRGLRPRRMVITGEPGAGKTVLARKFVMELNRVRTEGEPVPVLVALADWDAGEPFRDWLTRHLQRDYGLPPASARRVVAARMVLPVLDGLDEMDATGTAPEGSRAARALTALGDFQDGTDPAPLVLTCRSSEYDALEAAGSHILDAARLEIAPVTPERARDFLALRGARRPALWDPILDELRTAPGGVLARALSTPWRLTLAAIVYDRDGDPGELLTPATPEAVAEVLLGRYVGAAVERAPLGPRRFPAEEVHRRLRALATHLDGATDLPLWDFGRRFGSRRLRGVALGVVALLSGAAAAGGVAPVFGWEWAAVAGLVVSAACSLSPLSKHGGDAQQMWHMPKLGSPLWRVGARRTWQSGSERRMMLFWSGVFVFVVTTSAFVMERDNLEHWLTVVVTLVVVAMVHLNQMTVRLDVATVDPPGWVRGALFGWTTCVFVQVVTCLMVLMEGHELLDVGMVIVMPVLACFMGWPAAEYALVVLLHRDVPFRLARFLDWSVAAGLMRTSGVAYQFRHREFQEWLVRHPEP
ncbi:NACHT domain-containing protein [Streptomyces gardneri]|uniref:NACHT domain-containing protein n=1 Tax=Streptomyces gardneri TaxID=66892 RepID=UPI0037D2E750